MINDSSGWNYRIRYTINISYPAQSVYHAAGGKDKIGSQMTEKARSAVAGDAFVWAFKVES